MKRNDAMTMPFGKYRGKAIAELPTDYLKWGFLKTEQADRALLSAIEDELVDRGEGL